jgi:hypothetical protein
MSDFEGNSNTNNTEMIVPYVIYNYSEHTGSNIQYGSTTNDKLYNILTDILKSYMRQHDFNMLRKYHNDDDDDDDDNYNDNDGNGYNSSNSVSELTCDICWSSVVSKTYIKLKEDGKKVCYMCNSDLIINRKAFLHFKKYLKKNKENCDIIYFKDGKWNDFEIV